MVYSTEAKEAVDNTLKSVQTAIEELGGLLISDSRLEHCTVGDQNSIREAFDKLRKVRKLLKKGYDY